MLSYSTFAMSDTNENKIIIKSLRFKYSGNSSPIKFLKELEFVLHSSSFHFTFFVLFLSKIWLSWDHNLWHSLEVWSPILLQESTCVPLVPYRLGFQLLFACFCLCLLWVPKTVPEVFPFRRWRTDSGICAGFTQLSWDELVAGDIVFLLPQNPLQNVKSFLCGSGSGKCIKVWRVSKPNCLLHWYM